MENTSIAIRWTPVTIKLKDLIPWERNPRQISKSQAERLIDSWNRFGQVEALAIGPAQDKGRMCPVYNGHQRLSVLRVRYGINYEVDARQSSRDLTEEERRQLTIYLHRGTIGEFNMDELANWDTPSLLNWGFEKSDLGLSDFDILDDGQALGNNYRLAMSQSISVVAFGRVAERIDVHLVEKTTEIVKTLFPGDHPLLDLCNYLCQAAELQPLFSKKDSE